MMAESLDIGADLLSLREIGPWIEESLATASVPDAAKLRAGMELALQEIGVNVVKHAYGGPSDARIQLSLTIDAKLATVVVVDSGKAFEAKDRPIVDLDTPTVGGYGLFLIEKLCESVAYDRVDEENRWTVTFALSSHVQT